MAKFVEISTEGIFSKNLQKRKRKIPTYVIPLEGNYVSLKIQQIGG